VRRVKGVSDIMAVVIVTSVIIMIGVGLWSFLSSYTGILRNQEVKTLGEQALVLRSNIGADYVFFPDRIYGAGSGVVAVRNAGREPVVVFRLIVINNGTVVHDTGVSEIVHVPVGEVRPVSFRCPGCLEGDPITVQVHYMPEALFTPEDPRLSQRESQTILFKIASFEAKPSIAGSGLSCPVVTGDWVLVELVDPKEDNIYGQTTDFVKIRVLNASRPLPSYDLGVSVRDRYGEEGVGSVSVTGPLPQEVYVRLNRGGLQPPLQFEVVSEDPNLTVIPFEWGFSNSFGNFIDFTKLRINLERFLIDEIIVSSGFYESGEYEFIVDVYDCRGALVSSGSLRVNVTVGSLAGYFEQYSIVLRPPVNVFNIGRIVFRSVDLTPVVTVTTTLTITETSTGTRTTTTTTTSTVTKTTTTITTTTRTTTIPATTTTTTRTSTRTTTTTISTATSTVTRTTTSFTATVTTTSSTTTTYTSTSYSPTITITNTDTQTSYTTTRTTTSTSTRTFTATTTTTTTTTTTVTGGQGGMMPLVGSDRSYLSPGWWLYVLVGGQALTVPLWRWFRSWRARGVEAA
jgi:hypothetical protein